jgi:hypothetical protein
VVKILLEPVLVLVAYNLTITLSVVLNAVATVETPVQVISSSVVLLNSPEVTLKIVVIPVPFDAHFCTTALKYAEPPSNEECTKNSKFPAGIVSTEGEFGSVTNSETNASVEFNVVVAVDTVFGDGYSNAFL